MIWHNLNQNYNDHILHLQLKNCQEGKSDIKILKKTLEKGNTSTKKLQLQPIVTYSDYIIMIKGNRCGASRGRSKPPPSILVILLHVVKNENVTNGLVEIIGWY